MPEPAPAAPPTASDEPNAYRRPLRAEWADTAKPLDAWWTVVVIDRLAMPLTALVTPWRWVTATRLTVVAHLLGLVVAGLLATGNLLAAGLLFEVRFVLDCMDGKLSRARGTQSESGAYLDFMGDAAIVALCLGTVTVHEFGRDGLPLAAVAITPAMFLAMIGVHLARFQRLGEGGTTLGRIHGLVGDGVTGWMARHRLRPLPGRVEFEHLALGVAPIAAAVTGQRWLLTAGLALLTLYGLEQVLHVSVEEYRVRRPT